MCMPHRSEEGNHLLELYWFKEAAGGQTRPPMFTHHHRLQSYSSLNVQLVTMSEIDARYMHNC
jgi:hypothetical protein